jgi:hypothetical protein
LEFTLELVQGSRLEEYLVQQLLLAKLSYHLVLSMAQVHITLICTQDHILVLGRRRNHR